MSGCVRILTKPLDRLNRAERVDEVHIFDQSISGPHITAQRRELYA